MAAKSSHCDEAGTAMARQRHSVAGYRRHVLGNAGTCRGIYRVVCLQADWEVVLFPFVVESYGNSTPNSWTVFSKCVLPPQMMQVDNSVAETIGVQILYRPTAPSL